MHNKYGVAPFFQKWKKRLKMLTTARAGRVRRYSHLPRGFGNKHYWTQLRTRYIKIHTDSIPVVSTYFDSALPLRKRRHFDRCGVAALTERDSLNAWAPTLPTPSFTDASGDGVWMSPSLVFISIVLLAISLLLMYVRICAYIFDSIWMYGFDLCTLPVHRDHNAMSFPEEAQGRSSY